MKALFVWDSDYPWDIRVEKICSTMMKSGWQVHLVCRNRNRNPLEEIYEGIHIHRIPFLPQKTGTLNDIFTFPAFFSPIWLDRINRVAKKENIDLIIVRDLPMALAAISVARINKLPVILDMAECYPEFIRLIWKFEPFKIHNIFLRNPLAVDLIEVLSTRLVDHIFVMIEESRNRLINKGICIDKITIVSNTPSLHKFQKKRASLPGIIKKKEGKLSLIYVGFLDFTRDLFTVLKSLRRLVDINKNFYLVVVGNGSAERYLHKMAKKLNVEKYIDFEGWVDNTIVPKYIASADICLVPHHKCGHWDNTIPNKLFDYMAAGKAVLVSNAEPMKRIVLHYNCGLVYQAGDERSFVSQILKLQRPKIREELGINGIKAIEQRFNWGVDSRNMFDALEKVMKKVS